MKPLILTGSLIPDFVRAGLADIALELSLFDLAWGPPPSAGAIAGYLGPRTAGQAKGAHWSDWCGHWATSEARAHRDLSLTDFCQQYEAVELWFDMEPKAQLLLVLLLDHLRSCSGAVARLKLRLVDLEMLALGPDASGKWRPPVVDVKGRELATASAAWQAYRSPTPEKCAALLSEDLSVLPLLKSALRDLLEELPSVSTGLGASEMRMLEMIARGYSLTNALFYLKQLRGTRVFGAPELGTLLEGLAHGPTPAVAGLDDDLRTIPRENHKARDAAYKRSELSLTEFGKAVVAHTQDFSRHNPIDRWWGGTHLTSDSLWRWGPGLATP